MMLESRQASANEAWLPTHDELQPSYDFIVVGGGAAGLALAVRLSECESQNVLVLEAGQFPEIVGSYKSLGAGQQVLGMGKSAFTTPAQESLGNRTITYHRGRGVGGSTLINGLTYGRGSRSVYDLWQDMGNDDWDWDSILPLFQKSTSFHPVNVAPYQTYDASAYSTNGPIQLSYPIYVYGSSTAFLEAPSAVNVSTVFDLNLGDNIGAKQEPLVLDKRQQRLSSYDSYYKPARNRTNLAVMQLAQVHKLMLERQNGSLVATGVVFTDSTSGHILNVNASKGVILSAGVFQTPQLLMLSGLGPQETLQEMGISEYLINENTGRNMQDHFYFSIIAHASANDSASETYNRIDLLRAAQQEYAASNSGLLTTPIGPTYGFQQLPSAELQSLGAAQALMNRTRQAHIEYLWENIYYPSAPPTILPQYPPNRDESFISVTAALLSPVSRGNVTLQSNAIQDAPLINVNYLESEIDQKFALKMFYNLRGILSQPVLSRHTTRLDNGEVVPGANVTDGTTVLDYDAGGVVDSRLRVYGAKKLRIVDASIFPVVPDQHTQGQIYMVAEKAASMIKEDHGLS
ncbi:hypothetical protein WHR41_09478 [Cladosporium halotolerans]|uniref:Glucose-methanol-choline oxidoreductase N-terminal domain-containing protein n=1 Tax=Cladosporium halotolerans TaxID=1052096 RepID=A0AB34K9K0_9PEZI